MTHAPELLSWVTFAPLAVALALLALDGLASAAGRPVAPELWKGAGLAGSALTFVLSLGLWAGFDPTRTGYQFVEYTSWLPQYGIHYFAGIDGVSLLLILLTTFLMPIVLLASWDEVERSPKS